MNKKYFTAIVLPPPILSEIEAIKHDLFLKHNLRGALLSPAHITLHRPFEWREEKESQLIDILKKVEFKTGFKVELKNYNFFEPRVIFIDVLKNNILKELHTSIKKFAQKELKLLNEINDLRGFYPHVTVAFRDLKKPLFYELKKGFETKEYYNSFNYSGFSLLKFEKKWEEICFFEK